MSRNIDSVVKETLKQYCRIIYSRAIILPVICRGQVTVFTVINPTGIVLPDFASRSFSFILSLHSGDEDTRPNTTDVSRRLRLFLNKVIQCDDSCPSDVKINHRNLKTFCPEGKFIHFVLLLLRASIRILIFLKFQSNIHQWIMESQHSN